MKKAVLLLNLGTPDNPTPEAVGAYLREFLMDPLVIDIPWVFRTVLVNALIVPRRSHASAKLYDKIWTQRGSPLLFHTQDLEKAVQEKLGEEYRVVAGMRYGNPSFEAAVEKLVGQDLSSVTIVPLYPQYALAATESSLRKIRTVLDKRLPGIKRVEVPAFYNNENYLNAVAEVSRKPLHEFKSDLVLFSFHGLPERQIRKTKTGKACVFTKECCSHITPQNADCYRAQSFATARLLAEKLDIPVGKYKVSFQSRLGTTPWIRPFADEFYRTFPSLGIKNLAVLCPSFVADCLETLEEVQMRGQEEFRRYGGLNLKLIPSLNSHPAWVQGLSRMVQDYQPSK